MTDEEIKAIADSVWGCGLFKALEHMRWRQYECAAGLMKGFPRLGDILADANARRGEEESMAPAAKPALPARALSGRRCIVGLRLP